MTIPFFTLVLYIYDESEGQVLCVYVTMGWLSLMTDSKIGLQGSSDVWLIWHGASKAFIV